MNEFHAIYISFVMHSIEQKQKKFQISISRTIYIFIIMNLIPVPVHFSIWRLMVEIEFLFFMHKTMISLSISYFMWSNNNQKNNQSLCSQRAAQVQIAAQQPSLCNQDRNPKMQIFILYTVRRSRAEEFIAVTKFSRQYTKS